MASRIKIRGRAEPIEVTREVALQVKDRKFGNEQKGIAKKESTDLLDLGSWAGEYGRVVEIEIEPLRKPEPPPPEPEKPLTPEEKEARRKFFEETGWALGFKKKEERKPVISRSGLEEYKAKFGKEYIVPPGTEILEDLPDNKKSDGKEI